MIITNVLRHEFRRRASKMPFIKRICSNFAMEYLPFKFKRLVFISSVLATIENSNEIDYKVLEKVNNQLSLAHDIEAMIYPIRFYKRIWNDTNYLADAIARYKEGNDQAIEDLAQYFYMQVPDWLLYASKNLIQFEIRSVLKQLSSQ